MNAKNDLVEIKLKPFSPKFKALYQLGKYRYKILHGGRGGGKSHAVVEAAIYMLHSFEGCRIVCLREVQKTLKDSSFQLFMDKIRDLGIESDFEAIDSEIRCLTTGSHVIFRGFYPDPTRLKGLEKYNIAIVEEAENVSDKSWKFLIPTIVRNKFAEIWIVFNPRFEDDPTWQFVINPRPKSYIAQINYLDNPHLDEGMIEEAEYDKNKDPEIYSWIWLGQPLRGSQRSIIPSWITKAAQERIPDRVPALRIAGLDLARDGIDSTSIWIRDGNEIVFHQNWKTPDLSNVPEQIEAIFYKTEFNVLLVDSIGLGSGVYDHIKKRLSNLCTIIPFNSSKPARNNKAYTNLRAECIYMLRDWLRDHGSLPKDPLLQSQFSVYQYKFDSSNRYQVESKEELHKRGAKSPDDLDALMMTFGPVPTHVAIQKIEDPQKQSAILAVTTKNDPRPIRRARSRGGYSG